MATRQINNFLAAEAFEADRLIAVEVLTSDGNWSSFPPHKHDEHTDSEVPLEEIYYFRIAGRGSASTGPTPRTGRSTPRSPSGTATSSSSPGGTTARAWPCPATPCTTST